MDKATQLQDQLDEVVTKNQDVFSAVLGVASRSGDFRWTGAAGKPFPDQPEIMQPDSPFFIASITKMYTAAATMILEEGGQLSLEDPLSKHLPADWLDGLHVYQGQDYSSQLTIHHLISQTSGLPDYFLEAPEGGQSFLDRMLTGQDREWNPAEIVAYTKKYLTPRFAPQPLTQNGSGGKAHYADTNYQLLGAVLEAVAEKPLQAIFSELVFEPLDLTSSYVYGYGDPQMASERPPAIFYYKSEPAKLEKTMKSFGPDGGIVSTLDDSLKFLSGFMEARLFKVETLERMKTWNKIFFPLQYGLGLMRFKLPWIFSPFAPNPEFVGHSGASSAFSFKSDIGDLYIVGTLNQLENQRRTFQLMMKVVNIVRK